MVDAVVALGAASSPPEPAGAGERATARKAPPTLVVRIAPALGDFEPGDLGVHREGEHGVLLGSQVAEE
ncbi:hypothetical protein GON03_17670 [Nocardioides sp. MAH-18]|uniref:Uncharacterized protein n=1 Tax=Nocardioides agri TaxID=2682843 RepID=A0A6L6XVC5_9ACTN|nr:MULTISPECIES: hypothetical protein [unclassified Nocardioides]MBA2956173.1 hypothetical protein [Nocardioides sp. CGMCC 1.13656]MVQ51018.1 hypothetical protein [Nocardioides sp. MAH-18]